MSSGQASDDPASASQDCECPGNATGSIIRVSIGLIRRDQSYLIRRRPERDGSPMPGYWEFPGGKCHPGESDRDCVYRECLEEVGLPVVVQSLRRIVRHKYPHGCVELHFFDCSMEAADAEPARDTGFLWVHVHDLPRYTFPGANETIIADLIREACARADATGN